MSAETMAFADSTLLMTALVAALRLDRPVTRLSVHLSVDSVPEVSVTYLVPDDEATRLAGIIQGATNDQMERTMFMETLRIEPDERLVYLGLMDGGPDGFRPAVDGPRLSITLPLDQFEPIMDQFDEAFASRAYERACKAAAKAIRTPTDEG